MRTSATKRKSEYDEDFSSKKQRLQNDDKDNVMDIDSNNKSSSSEDSKSSVLQNPNEVRSSKYDSVYWLESESKWVAQLTHRKRAYPIGKFDNELEAAVAVNFKCQDLNIPPKNPGLNQMLAANTTEHSEIKTEQNQNKTYPKSDYIGVSWDKREQKWLARFTYRGKPHFVGYFDDEIEAASAINGRCSYLNIPIKNKNIQSDNIAGYAKQVARPFSGKSSKYSSVYWEQESKMWHARLNYNGKSISSGRFHSEIDAAIAVNTKCSELGLPLKNPDVQGYTVAPRHGEKKTSQYKHVNWDRSSKKWRAQMSIDGKQTYIGLYESERAAAIAVNDKCRELGIPLRNQILDFDQNTTDITQKPFFRYSSDVRKDANMFNNRRVPENGKVQQNGYSKFSCVYWDHRTHVWYGVIRHYEKDIHEKLYHCGFFENEIDAANAVNQKCRELGIPPKNPILDSKMQRPESDYECVFWDDNAKVWTARFEFRGMVQNLGNFISDVEAAKAVNLKCEQYGIPPKHPNVGAAVNNNSSDSNNNHSSDLHATNGKESSSNNDNEKSVASMSNEDFDQEAFDALKRELAAKNRKIHENEMQLKNQEKEIIEQNEAMGEEARIIQEQKEELSIQQALMDSLQNSEIEKKNAK